MEREWNIADASLEQIEERAAKFSKFPEDSIVLQEGEVNLDMYKIIQGYAELYTGYGTEQEIVLGILGPGDVFGEFGLLLHEPAIYTVVAHSDLYALRITEGEMGDFVQQNHKNIIEIMQHMALTMLIMQKQIHLLAEEISEHGKPVEETLQTLTKNVRSEYAAFNPDRKNYATQQTKKK